MTGKVISDAMQLMGHRVRDKITELEGVCVSVSFDLFGCVQGMIDPGFDKDGKAKDRYWMDTTRLTIVTTKRIMPLPDFGGEIAPKPPDHGPANKSGATSR